MKTLFAMMAMCFMFMGLGCTEDCDECSDEDGDCNDTGCPDSDCPWEDGCDECMGQEDLTVEMDHENGRYEVYRCCDGDKVASGPKVYGNGLDDTTHILDACTESPGRCYQIFFLDVEDHYTPPSQMIELMVGSPVRVLGEYEPKDDTDDG